MDKDQTEEKEKEEKDIEEAYYEDIEIWDTFDKITNDETLRRKKGIIGFI